jgi:integrase
VYGQPIGRVSLAKLSKAHCAAWRAWLIDYCGGNKSSFNRNVTPLRRALNLALDAGQVGTDQAWRTALRPFGKREGGDGKRRELYLSAAQRRKLIECASDEARALFVAMNLQPVRPGDIPAARVSDLDLVNRTLRLAGKGNERTVPLGREAFEHFKRCAAGKLPGAWLIARASGDQWKKEAWRDEVKAAAAAAKLPAATVANTLRHSVITDLVKGGLDIFHVAKLSGTSVKMIEEHYGHLQHDHARKALDKLATLA